MNGKVLLPVAEARARILADLPGPIAERVPLAQALGRTLVEPLVALRTQPPFAASAMDGFAVRSGDVATLPAQLKLIGVSAAGRRFDGAIGAGETVRIFTGAPMPKGADSVLIQEDAAVEDDRVMPTRSVAAGRHVRTAGLDFTQGNALLAAGTRLGPIEIALAAAMGHADVTVDRRPRVAILATGDELVKPGEPVGPDQIVASNSFAVAGYVRLAGGEPIDLGIAGDNFEALEKAMIAAREAKADVLVTLGGASVGAHDLVRSALSKEGMELGFWRIAMRPGKPLIHGRLGGMIILGLPGNPAASIVCSVLFLLPLIRALSGDPRAGADQSEPARLGAALPGNDRREDYLRAALAPAKDELPIATPFELQDSSLLSIFAQSQCLIIRTPHAPAAQKGDVCQILRLPNLDP